MPADLHQWLVDADMQAWYKLHAEWRSSFLDVVMPYLRNPFFWAPLYLFLIGYAVQNSKRKGLLWCLGFLLCFAFGDFISAHILKPCFHRIRPCNDPRLAQALHLIVERSSGLSFPSSHASNHFAMGTYMAATLGRRNRWVIVASFIWAAAIAYAQVYVGVHFPGDVLGGALLGIAIGALLAWAYRKLHPDAPLLVRRSKVSVAPE